MGILFFLLACASFICLIIGLIKPKVFSWLVKRSVTRKKIGLIFGIAIFVFLVLFVMAFNTGSINQTIGSKPSISVDTVKTQTDLSPTSDTIVTANLKTIASTTRSSTPAKPSKTITTTTTTTTVASATTLTTQLSSFPLPSRTTGCHEDNGLPDLACTPGAIDPRVTQDNIYSTICVSGYTATVRPSTTYTNNLKTQQIIAYGYVDTSLSDYEEDHFIPLEIGGSPTSPANLWPEPYNNTYGARVKDKVENYLHEQICNGSMSLAEAQKEITANWETIYSAHYGSASTTSTSYSSSQNNVSSSSSSTTTIVNTGSYPTGITGICKDGTYTKAINHQGACSSHGGVSQWIVK